MYTVGRYISQGVYTVAGPFHPFGGAVDIIVVEQEDGTFKSTPWYVKFGKFQGVLKRREKVVDVAVNGNDVNFHMYLDATGEAYFLKDADSDTEVSILSPPSAASSGDDIVVETLAVEAVKPDNNVQAKVEIQESKEAAEKPCSRGEKKEILELTLESRDLSSVLVHEVPASQYEVSETVLASPHQDEVASDTGIDVEDGAPDGSSNRDEHGVANGQSDKGQVSDELLSTARGFARHVNTAEGQKTIHALLNHAIGLDPFCESGPAGSLVANAALSALEKVATVQPPSTLLRNSNQALPVVHFIREVTGSSLQGSNSLDSRLVETLPKVEFLRNRSGYNLNGPSGITIASADGGMILEAPCTEELGVVHSKLAQQGQWPSEADPTVSAPQHNETFDPLSSPHTRPECSDLLVETEHEVSEEHKEKKDWNGARTLSKPTEVVEHTSKSGHVEPSENENDKYDADCALDGIAFGSLSGENGEMMQGAGEELPECRVLPSTAEREALQVEVAGSEVHCSAPSNGSVGDPLSGLQDSTLEKMQISSEIEPNLEDTRSLDVMEGSIRLKETTEIGHANEPVVSVPSEENLTSSIEEGDPSPSLKAAVAREMAWRDATEKAAAVLRTSPLCTKSHQTRQRVDRRIKPGGSLRSLPKITGHNQNLPSNSTPAALDKNMDSQELSKLAQKKADVTEQSERKPWIWWNWRATPSLPKQSSDQVEKKETKEVKGTTNQAGEDNMQTSSYAPDADSHSSTSIDVRSSTMKEANKMLREDDSRVSTEEVVVNSTKQSLTVAMRNKEGLAEQKMKNRGPEEEENQEEKREEFTPEVESSNAVQKSEPKGAQEENNEEFTLGVESSTTIQKSQGKEAENLARRSILGIVFRGYGRERPLAGPDCALERVSSLQTAEIVSDLLDNSWGYGSGGKSRQGTANNSQATAVSSSLNSQCMAAVSNSKSKTSDSQTSFTAETMGPEEEPVTNERTDVPANKYSTLNSSLHLQGGEGSRTEAADNCGNSWLSEPSSTDADCATTADCPSFVGIDIAAGEKGPEIVTDEDTLQDSGETGLQGERSNAKNNDSGSVRASSMSMKEKLSGLSLGATTTSAVLMEEVEGSSSKVKMFNLPDRLQDEVSQDAASVSTFSQEVVSPHECTRRVSFPVAVDSLTTGHRQHEQKVVAENAYLKDLAVLSVEDLVGPDKEWSSNSAAEVVLVSGAGSFVMAPVDPMGPCGIEDSTSAAPVLFSDEEKPSNKEGNAVDDSDLQGSISEHRVPALSPVQDEIMATGVGSSSTELLHKNLALLQASPMQDGAHDTQINVVQVAQTMPVGTEVLEIVKAVKAIPETREMDEVVTKTNELNRSEGELKKPLSYRGTGAASRNSIYFEAYNSEQEEEEGHGKVAVGEIDHLGITSHGENESDDEIENPLSYNDVGSASRTSIYFEANTSEEEDDEDHAQVVDADVDLETSRRQSDPIGIPVTVENLARDELYVVAKDRPLSESLPDVMFESVDRDISDIQSALSRSVGSEPLQHTQRSAGRRDSSLENYVRSPAEGTHEQLEGFMENIEKKGVRSLVGSGSSKDESSGEDGAEPDGVETATETGVELSLCRHLLKEHMGMEEAAEAFTSARVSLHEFKNSSASIMANDKLIIRVGGQYYPWNVAAPIVLGILAFGQVIMPVTDSAIPVERPEPVEKSQAVGTLVPTATGGWKLWPFPLRRPRTPEQGIATNSLASRDAFLETAGTAVQSPFVNNSHLQNGYYERPRKNKVRTIIPTSQMLAQMNLKEGSNRITFTFFTRMLGKQQVDARVYLWKWNTRIVISDVDGTITKSDVLGQVMPLVGKDWTQSGVARLFSSIKENGYELLFLSARAISQADLTRQFLFNVKQDGETLPNGPVVISPDGLFPSLYREVIRRTPHEFKIACLQDIRSLFPEDCNPFYAGFGNRDTDEISYLKVGIPKGKVFIINPRGEVAVNNRVDVRTYTSLHKLVNDMFPAQTYVEQEDYNLWNFWKLPLPDIEDELKSVSASSSKRS